jgi:serine protease Do
MRNNIKPFMSRFSHTAVCLVCLLLVMGTGCSKESDNTSLLTENKTERPHLDETQAITPQTFVKLAEQEKPAVVNISITKIIKDHPKIFRYPFGRGNNPFEEFFERFFGDIPQQDFKQKSLGSGFIISKDGYILTNSHVVEDVDEIMITLFNHKEFEAKVIGVDSKTDIALIKIKTWKDLPIAALGDSDKLEVGEWVIAIGNPFGLEHTVTVGIVSAKGRVIGAGPYDEFIQTDASINPGNSGGPLFNIYGEVIGINTAIIPEGQGIGFAIPINVAKDILDDLKQKGEVERGWLGVLIQKVTPDLAEGFGLKEPVGALVAKVIEDSPADKAGLKRGDIILSFDGQKIMEYSDLSRMAAKTKRGKKIVLEIIRDGNPQKISVNIGLYPKDDELALNNRPHSYRLGMKVEDIPADIENYMNKNIPGGVIVSEIEPGGPAQGAGLRTGDVILELNRQPINNITDYGAALQKLKADETVLLLILRDDTTKFVALKQK